MKLVNYKIMKYLFEILTRFKSESGVCAKVCKAIWCLCSNSNNFFDLINMNDNSFFIMLLFRICKQNITKYAQLRNHTKFIDRVSERCFLSGNGPQCSCSLDNERWAINFNNSVQNLFCLLYKFLSRKTHNPRRNRNWHDKCYFIGFGKSFGLAKHSAFGLSSSLFSY